MIESSREIGREKKSCCGQLVEAKIREDWNDGVALEEWS